jgi:signal transduction histidine kinase
LRPVRGTIVNSQTLIPIVRRHRHGRPFPACECAVLQVLNDGQPLKNHEDVVIRKDGTFFDVIHSIAPLRNDDGKVTGLVVVFSDITERKQAETALREADRRKDEFIAMLSHELRNPLAPIRNGLLVLRKSGGQGPASALDTQYPRAFSRCGSVVPK